MRKKSDIVTFKVDQAMYDALQSIPNRSNFIRSAILAALDNTCPLCSGTGIMTPNQKKHWESFRRTHTVEECADCKEFHLVCAAEESV
jgi:hypothetical protein